MKIDFWESCGRLVVEDYCRTSGELGGVWLAAEGWCARLVFRLKGEGEAGWGCYDSTGFRGVQIGRAHV